MRANLQPRFSTAQAPEPDGSDISRRLARRIRTEIQDARLDRVRALHGARALRTGTGLLHNNGGVKFGPRGDFVTAPELSPVLAGALAARLADVLRPLDDPVVLEVGAGTGRLTADLARALRALDIRARHWILDGSPELRSRQRRRCAAAGVQARWLDGFPAGPIDGAIIANEVLDAFPATCFVKRAGEVLPLGVGREERNGSPGRKALPTRNCAGRVASLESTPWASFWRTATVPKSRAGCPHGCERVADALRRGAVFILDYGLPEAEYHHPQRARGTLICHYRHRAHDDPFLFPGLQDISAWVDFSACARAAREAGLAVAGFTTQGQFLVESGTMPDMRNPTPKPRTWPPPRR